MSKIHIFDLDDTLVSHDDEEHAPIHVLKHGELIKEISPDEYKKYTLQEGEKFHFPNTFLMVEYFIKTATPIVPMVDKMKTLALAGEETIIMTARQTFDYQETFLAYMNNLLGFDVTVYMSGDHLHEFPYINKRVSFKTLIEDHKYQDISFYDDSAMNMDMFFNLKSDYPHLTLHGHYVKYDKKTQNLKVIQQNL